MYKPAVSNQDSGRSVGKPVATPGGVSDAIRPYDDERWDDDAGRAEDDWGDPDEFAGPPIVTEASFGEWTGTAFLFRADLVSRERLVAPAEALRTATLAPSAPVLWGGRRIGEAYALTYSERDASLACLFKHGGGPSLPADQVVVSPTLSVKRAACGSCGTSFRPQDPPCSCIRRAPVIILQKFIVTAVSLLDSKHKETEEQKNRTALFLQLFGGALGGLAFSKAGGARPPTQGPMI